MADNTQAEKPAWLPDTQGFLAIAIIVLIGFIVAVLLIKPPAIDERVSGVLMTVIGVLIACLKDVYSFFFGSSKGSSEKDKTIQDFVGTGSGLPTTTVTTVPTAPATTPTTTTVTKEDHKP